MAFKTIFTALSDEKAIEPVLNAVEAMASVEDSHVDILCLGVDRTQTGYYYAGANAMVLQETITRATREAEEIKEAVDARLEGGSVRFATDTAVAALADLTRPVAARARFSDLCILPKPYGEACGPEMEAIVEAALFQGHAPVLVIPDSGMIATHPERICLGWNESAEALAATKAALPLLKSAEKVSITVIDPPVHGVGRSDPGGLLSQFLARHGVRAEIDVLSKSLPRVSDVLMRHASDMSADMVVMGAYGHSRFREAILGGATRNMMETVPIPIFMAH